MIWLSVLGFLVVMFLSKLRSRSLFKRQKKRCHWGTSIPVRGPFRAAKCAGWVPPPELQARAQAFRQERLAKQTNAERKLGQIITGIGWQPDRDFEPEAIFYYPKSFVIFDVFFRSLFAVVEADGEYHAELSQHGHDVGRDWYFEKQHNIRTLRLVNEIILADAPYCERILLRFLGRPR